MKDGNIKLLLIQTRKEKKKGRIRFYKKLHPTTSINLYDADHPDCQNPVHGERRKKKEFRPAKLKRERERDKLCREGAQSF